MHPAAAAGLVHKEETKVVAIKLLQTRPRGRKPYALGERALAPVGQPAAVVNHFQLQRVKSPARADFDAASCKARSQPVTYGIFNQRLQDQVRHHGLTRFLFHVHPYRQPVVEADFLNVQIDLHEIEFFL